MQFTVAEQLPDVVALLARVQMGKSSNLVDTILPIRRKLLYEIWVGRPELLESGPALPNSGRLYDAIM